MRRINLAIFDFCDTLVSFQSADAFTNFVISKEGGVKNLIVSAVNKTFSTFRIYSVFKKLDVFQNLQKRILLSCLNGITKNRLNNLAEEFEENVVQNNLNKELINLLKEHISNGDKVIINSGGYEPYLNFFAKRMGISSVYSTQIEFIDGICTGKILGKDCLYDEKVTRMKKDGIDFNQFKEVFVYSDSVTDMPLFNIATQKIAVIKGEVIPKWCESSMFQILKV